MPIPDNITCALAEVISLPFSFSDVLTGGWTDPEVPDSDCNSGLSNNPLWYKLVAPATNFVQVSLQDDTGNSTVTVFTGACGSLVFYNCIFAGTIETLAVTPGTTYWFFVTQLELLEGTSNTVTFGLALPEPIGQFCIELTCSNTPVVGSGLYYIERGKRNDTIFTGYNPETTEDVEIPNPFWETYYAGDE